MSARFAIGVDDVTNSVRALVTHIATDEDRQRTRASWNAGDVFVSVLVMALISAAYSCFQD